MHVYNGFFELLKNVNELPDLGWIFLEKSTDRQSEKALRNASYYVGTDDDEEMELERTKKLFWKGATKSSGWKI